MFYKEITATAFTNAAANAYFNSKVTGGDFRGDLSMVSTLRALLINRIGDNHIYIECSTLSYTESRLRSTSATDMADRIRSRYDEYNTFTIVQLTNDNKESRQTIYNIIDQHFANDNWVKLTPITNFFKRNFDCVVFANEGMQSTVAFFMDLDVRKLHQFQTAALTALPWYFNPAAGDRLTEDERNLLESLQMKDEVRYLQCLEKLAEGFDFDRKFIESALTNLEQVYEKQKLESVRNDMETCNSNIANYYNEIQNLIQKLNDLNTLYFGLQNKLEATGGSSPLRDLFLRSKALKLDRVDGTSMWYHVRTYLSYWNESIALNSIENKRSIIYRFSNYSEELTEKFAMALFIDQTIRLRMSAGYTLDVRGRFDGVGAYSMLGEDAHSYMPNKHVNGFSCTGENGRTALEYLKNRNFVMAVSQSISSAGSINFAESITYEGFIHDLFAYENKPWFELPDGSLADLRRVMNYLEQEEKEKKENE